MPDLISSVPGPYAPRMSDLLTRVYKICLKANHVRSHLTALEKYKESSDLPSEIRGRIRIPIIQLSKEFSETCECQNLQNTLDQSLRNFQAQMLDFFIATKQSELRFLHTLGSEAVYLEQAESILHEVTRDICLSQGIAININGSVDTSHLPSFLEEDYHEFKSYMKLYHSKATSLACISISKDAAAKAKAGALKKENPDKSLSISGVVTKKSIEELVDQRVRQVLKEASQKPQGTKAAKSESNSSPATSPCKIISPLTSCPRKLSG